MTPEQIEILKENARLAVRTYAGNKEMLYSKLNQIDDFITSAFFLDLISKTEVTEIQKEVNAAAAAEVKKILREIA